MTSTQDAAADLPLGAVLVADEQTAGRGRLDRGWQTPADSGLAATFVVPPDPLLSLRAGVAAAEACGADVRLKWPNDLLLGGRKLGGVLIEVRSGRALVGVGINVGWAPPGAARLGGSRESLLERLDRRLTDWLAASAETVISRSRELSDTLGQQVRVVLPGETFEGLAEDIAEDGALVVAGRRVSAGDVLRLVSPGVEAEPRPHDRG